jgi:hypothetical protein
MDVHDVLSYYYIKMLRNLTYTSPELLRSRALTMLSGIYLVDLRFLFCHSSLRVRIAVFDFRLSCYTTRETLQHSTRAVAIARTDDFLRVFFPQLVEPWVQPASAAACKRVLEPDILEVSHLSHLLSTVNSHALPSVNSICLLYIV